MINMKKSFSARDIEKLLNFECRLNKKLGLPPRKDIEHFMRKVYNSYKRPSGEFMPRDFPGSLHDFFALSLSKRKKLEKAYYLSILQKRWNDAIELSKMHGVKF